MKDETQLLLLQNLLILIDTHSHKDLGISLCHMIDYICFLPWTFPSPFSYCKNVILCTSFFPTSWIMVNLQDSKFCLHIATLCHLQKMSFSTIHSFLLIKSCPCILSLCFKTFSGLVHKATHCWGNFATHLWFSEIKINSCTPWSTLTLFSSSLIQDTFCFETEAALWKVHFKYG